MQGARAQQIESAVIAASSAAFAAAVGYACLAVGRSLAAPMSFRPAAMAAAAAVAGFLLCRKMLSAVDRAEPIYALNAFDISLVEPMPAAEADELLLTDSDRVLDAADSEPLELDDVLAELAPDSRVVRLFDPNSMPTPGELGDRIDYHLGEAAPSRPPVDASQDLFDALAELRRSLR